MGTAAGISLPSASAPINEKTSASASSDDYDYSLGGTIASAEYSPLTTLASGNVASAAGATGSTWGAGADSSVGGAASSPATTSEGSSLSQDRSVDFLQSTQVGCQSSSTTTSSTTREDPTLTSLTEPPSRSGRRGCWRCPPVQPRQAPPLAPLRPLPLLQYQQPVQRSPALLRPPLPPQQ
jgi:hypothetical protein